MHDPKSMYDWKRTHCFIQIVETVHHRQTLVTEYQARNTALNVLFYFYLKQV